jgi:hypothetical protein
MTLRLILTLSLALVPFAASAAPAAKKAADARASEPAPSRVYDFDPDDVEGESLRPEGTDVGTRPPGRRESMIKVRAHFIPQLLKIAIDI